MDAIYELVFNACTEHPAYVDLLNSPVLAVDDGNNGIQGNAVIPVRKRLAFLVTQPVNAMTTQASKKELK